MLSDAFIFIYQLTELQYEAAWKTSKWEGIGDK